MPGECGCSRVSLEENAMRAMNPAASQALEPLQTDEAPTPRGCWDERAKKLSIAGADACYFLKEAKSAILRTLGKTFPMGRAAGRPVPRIIYRGETMAKVKKLKKPGQETAARPRCGLCGKTGKLTKTECCDQWICDDEDQYVLFSYARNSCYRNHDRYTLCGFHYTEGHAGHWKTCPKCRESFETELYVHYGTNEYNFERLENPPRYKPTRCAQCKAIIRLGEDGYSVQGRQYICMACSGFKW